MSKIKLAQKIKVEIKKLNREIDLKIIKGLPYKAEARRHRFLVSQFYGFYDTYRANWFKKTIYNLATFML